MFLLRTPRDIAHFQVSDTFFSYPLAEQKFNFGFRQHSEKEKKNTDLQT